MNRFIQQAAETDVARQVGRYAEQGLPHIARRFHVAVQTAIEALTATPEAGPPRPTTNPTLSGLRAWPVKGFDGFWIYYLANPERLTPRERDVLRLISAGYSNREIAVALTMSEGSVKNHTSSVLSKLGARDRTRAVLRAIERGYI